MKHTNTHIILLWVNVIMLSLSSWMDYVKIEDIQKRIAALERTATSSAPVEASHAPRVPK